jgi:hypothetical protein
MIITPDTSARFISKTRLPKAPPAPRRTRSGNGVADQPPLQLRATEAQALVVGSGLVVAADQVPVQVREDIINCVLFAQLVATAEVGDPSQVQAWYSAYFRALTMLGWAQSDQRFEEYDFSGQGLEAHKAVIPVLTALLGPQATALSVVSAMMQGLQEMEDNAPWLTLFEQQVRTEHSAAFQIATAEVGADGLLQVALVAFELKARAKLSQLLFFKYTSTTTQLRYSAGRATIFEAALAQQRADLAARMVPYRTAYVGSVKLPALPALPKPPVQRSRSSSQAPKARRSATTKG